MLLILLDSLISFDLEYKIGRFEMCFIMGDLDQDISLYLFLSYESSPFSRIDDN